MDNQVINDRYIYIYLSKIPIALDNYINRKKLVIRLTIKRTITI